MAACPPGPAAVRQLIRYFIQDIFKGIFGGGVLWILAEGELWGVDREREREPTAEACLLG